MISLGEMVAGVAHEINTPIGMALTGITHLETLTVDLKELYENENMSEEDFTEYIAENIELAKSIKLNLQKAATLIKSFKMVAVDQSSQEIREIRLKEYIQDILISLRSKLKHTKIKVNLNCEDIKIFINAGALSQIFTNLINNSIIHGFEKSEEGEININVKKVDNNLEIKYTDSGKGMSEKELKKAFDPFFTTKRGKGGSGLGLSIVYNLVTSLFGGEIKLKSKPAEGVEFFIKIPIKNKGESDD
jgi:signal transduction histidine kinase